MMYKHTSMRKTCGLASNRHNCTLGKNKYPISNFDLIHFEFNSKFKKIKDNNTLRVYLRVLPH